MYLLMNKNLNTQMLLLGLFLALCVQTQSYCAVDRRLKYKVYGTVGKTYSAREDHFGFYDEKAFATDNAYVFTIDRFGGGKFCVTASDIPIKKESALRIMSFNVHNFHKICAKEGELRKSPKYAVAVVGLINPDIVTLEEIVPYAHDEKAASKHHNRGPIAVNFSMLDKLMSTLGFTNNIKVNDFERHPNSDVKKLFMGKAIYTKNAFPIKAFSNSQIGNSPTNDRGYVSILFEYAGRRILLYDVHLSFRNPNMTKMEIGELLGFIRNDREKFGTENVIIIGDFNNDPHTAPEIFTALKEESYTLLNDMMSTAFNQNTETGEVIDLIYASKGFLDNFEVLSSNSMGKGAVVVKSDASDHWPVFFDFESKVLEVSTQHGAATSQGPMQAAKKKKSVKNFFSAVKQKLSRSASPHESSDSSGSLK